MSQRSGEHTRSKLTFLQKPSIKVRISQAQDWQKYSHILLIPTIWSHLGQKAAKHEDKMLKLTHFDVNWKGCSAGAAIKGLLSSYGAPDAVFIQAATRRSQQLSISNQALALQTIGAHLSYWQITEHTWSLHLNPKTCSFLREKVVEPLKKYRLTTSLPHTCDPVFFPQMWTGSIVRERVCACVC